MVCGPSPSDKTQLSARGGRGSRRALNRVVAPENDFMLTPRIPGSRVGVVAADIGDADPS
jgi:hypothetical protein